MSSPRQVCYLRGSPGSGLRGSLSSVWSEQRDCDVSVECAGGETVMAHRIVLAAASGLMADALIGAENDSDGNSVILAPDVPANALQNFLGLVYGGGDREVKVPADLECMGFNSDGRYCGRRRLLSRPRGRPASKRPRPRPRPRPATVSSSSSVVKVEPTDDEADAEAEAEAEADDDYLPPVPLDDDEYHPRMVAPKRRKKVSAPSPAVATLAGKPRKYKSGKKAFVWTYYTVINEESASCNTCEMAVRAESGNTTGLTRHLKHAHPDVFDALNRELQQSGTTTPESLKPELDGGEDADGLLPMPMPMPMPLSDYGDAADGVKKEEELAAAEDEYYDDEYLTLSDMEDVKMEDFGPSVGFPVEETDGRKQQRSAVWNHFAVVEGSDGHTQCHHCGKILSNIGKNTSNMLRHLAKKHDLMIIAKAVSAPDRDRDHKPDPKQKRGRPGQRRSPVWKYFTKTEDKVRCEICSKMLFKNETSSTSNLLRHLRNHPEEFNETMGVIYEANPNLLRRAPIAARGEGAPKKKRGPKPIDTSDPVTRTCSECHKEFATRQSMRYHKRVVHSGVRPHTCEECGKTFTRLDSWKQHGHSTDRNFLCSHCGKTFIKKKHRDVHERKHFLEYTERRFPCGYCDKKFITGQQRKNHERTHTGEKPFQCNMCGRQFAQRHQLTTHVRIHTGERPYGCQYCPQMFRHISSRNNHKCEGKVAAARASAAAASSAIANAQRSLAIGGGGGGGGGQHAAVAGAGAGSMASLTLAAAHAQEEDDDSSD